MSSRYADQLPINLAPNGANFLLATNDSDGKALERIPWDSLFEILLGNITPTQTANYTANPYEKVLIDTTGASFDVTLPDNGIVWIIDVGGNLAVNSLNVLPHSGGTVNGLASYSLAVNRGVWQFQLIGSDWVKFYGA